VVDLTKMTCQELVELVSAVLDGELDPATERRSMLPAEFRKLHPSADVRDR